MCLWSAGMSMCMGEIGGEKLWVSNNCQVTVHHAPVRIEQMAFLNLVD